MTAQCSDWLSVDWFLSHGFHLETTPGRRWVVRGRERYEVPDHCGHVDCPPHTTILKEAA